MNAMLRAYDRLIAALVPVAGGLIGAVCLLICWDVLARNLGLEPPASTVALTEYALLYVTMAATPHLVRTRGHVVIDILRARIAPWYQRALDRAACLLCAGVSFLVSALALTLSVEAALRGELDVRSLDIPRAWLFAPLAAGFLLAGVEFLRLLFRGDPVSRPVAERDTL